MIDIEYRYSSEPTQSENIRRGSIGEMSKYLRDLVSEMQMSDISSKFTEIRSEVPNMVYINGKSIPDILKGLEIKMLETEDSCDHNKINLMNIGRPTLDWNKNIIEDIPDVLVKNAISKVYADIIEGRTL